MNKTDWLEQPPISVSEEPLKAGDLDFYSLLRRRAGEGRLFFNQRRAVIFDVEALGALRQQLLNSLGKELAMGILTRFGYAHGYNDAKMLGENFDWETETDWLAAGPSIHTLEGIVHVTPQKIEFDRETGHFHMHGIWLNSYEAEEHLKLYGPSDHPVCWTLTGYASGYTSSFFGHDLLAIETECVGKGDARCYWEIRPVDQWGDEAKPYLKALEQVDISGQLFEANRRLQEQTRQQIQLNEMATELNLITNIDEVFRIAATKTKQIISTDRASITLLNPGGESYKVFALDDKTGAVPQGAELPVDETTGIGQAIKTGQAVIRHNIQTSDAPENRQLAQYGFHSAMVAPLVTGWRVIGTLNVGSKTPNAYDEHNKDMMLRIAGFLGTAIENQRLIDQMQKRTAETEEQARRLTLLSNLGTELSQTTNVNEVFKIVAIQTGVIVGSDRTSVALLDPTGDSFEVFALDGLKGAIPVGDKLPVEGTAIGKAVQEKQVITFLDIRKSDFSEHRQLAEQGLRSIIVAPLMAGGRVIGALNVGCKEVSAYTGRDENFLLQIASRLASTVENRRLLEQVRTTLDQTEALYEASRHITTATNLQEIVGAVVQGGSLPVINRAVLQIYEYDSAGEMEASYVAANWYSGEGSPPTSPGARYTRAGFATIELFLSSEPVFFNDTQQDERIDPPTKDLLKRLNVQAMAALPLWSGSRQMGVLLLQADEPHQFAQREIQSYASLAGQMAVAVENWRLLDDAQRRARRERILREVTARIRDSVDVDTVMRTAAREVGQALGRPAFVYLDGKKDGEEPETLEGNGQ